MAKLWLGKVKDKQIARSEYVVADLNDWLKNPENNGKTVRLTVDSTPVSDEIRGYYFAAIVPFMKTLSEDWKLLSTDDMHEVLKKQFNFFETWNAVTKRTERYGRTIMGGESNSAKAIEYIEKIKQWVLDNYALDLPNPEEYKDLRDRGLLQ